MRIFIHSSSICMPFEFCIIAQHPQTGVNNERKFDFVCFVFLVFLSFKIVDMLYHTRCIADVHSLRLANAANTHCFQSLLYCAQCTMYMNIIRLTKLIDSVSDLIVVRN